MTTQLKYSLLDPTGNITLLVETPVPIEDQPAVALELMKQEPSAEQAGFVSFDDAGIHLRMAGGEFCGNACMSAAALYRKRAHHSGCSTAQESSMVLVSVWGTAEPVPVRINALADSIWEGRVQMPLPLSIGRELFPDGQMLPVVRFPGITHVILEEEPDPVRAEALAGEWCRMLDTEALGLMFLNRKEHRLKPLVYVPAAGTLFWESSCASGTTAVGAFLARETGGTVELPLAQPGGTLFIEAAPDGRLFLSGRVRILKENRGGDRK